MIREARRVIAKAKHDNPAGKPCRAALSTLVTPSMSWEGTVKVDGQDLPVYVPGRNDNELAGWAYWQGLQVPVWFGNCPSCDKPVRMLGKLVRGKFKADKKCDGRCMAATGPNCECQCGGANHGASHG